MPDRDMILVANGVNDQARGAPFWVDTGHEFELLGEPEMLSDLEQHIGHEGEVTLQLEWESNPGPRPIPAPTAPGIMSEFRVVSFACRSDRPGR